MLHRIQATQFLQSDINTVWDFMSSPKNLAKITPSYMGFKIITPENEIETMYPGQIIEYYVKPILNIKTHWVTEITHVVENNYFVDEQRFGPYSFWHHKHTLVEKNGGVEMIDLVHYKLPLGILGKLANDLFVKKQLNSIFTHRYEFLENHFNKK